MLNSTTWLYGAEILPIALRSKIMGIGAASHFVVNVGSELYLHLYKPDTVYNQAWGLADMVNSY